jgi:hypothetical protein
VCGCEIEFYSPREAQFLFPTFTPLGLHAAPGDVVSRLGAQATFAQVEVGQNIPITSSGNLHKSLCSSGLGLSTCASVLLLHKFFD